MKAYVLLDRSGSMGGLWVEALGSINGYVDGLPAKSKVRVDVFDNVSYDTLRDCTKSAYSHLTNQDAQPRGGTPLNDSAGRLLTEVLASKDKKAVVIIMTDGYENASKEFTLPQVKELIKKVEDKGFEVIMLGANFSDVEKQAAGYGFAANKTMNISAKNLGETMSELSLMSTAYMSGTSRGITLDDSLKAAATK